MSFSFMAAAKKERKICVIFDSWLKLVEFKFKELF